MRDYFAMWLIILLAVIATGVTIALFASGVYFLFEGNLGLGIALIAGFLLLFSAELAFITMP